MTAVKIPEHVVEKIKALELMIELQEKELLQSNNNEQTGEVTSDTIFDC